MINQTFDHSRNCRIATSPDDGPQPSCRLKETDSEWIITDPDGALTEFYDLCQWCFADTDLDEVDELLRSSHQHGRCLHRSENSLSINESENQDNSATGPKSV